MQAFVTIRSAVAGGALLCAISASAANLGFLRDAVVADFSDSDWQHLTETAVDTLEHADDGGTRNWKNEETGNSGSVQLMESFEWHDYPCRRVRVTNRTESRTGSGVFRLCKVGGQGWKLAD